MIISDRLLHITQAHTLDNNEMFPLSYGYNCYGYERFKELQPKETPVQGCSSGYTSIPKALQAPIKF